MANPVEIIEVVPGPTPEHPRGGIELSDGTFVDLDRFPDEFRSEGFLAKLHAEHYLSLMS